MGCTKGALRKKLLQSIQPSYGERTRMGMGIEKLLPERQERMLLTM
jgi:hypothetical protein